MGLARIGWVWLGLGEFWLGLGGFGWVWVSLARFGWEHGLEQPVKKPLQKKKNTILDINYLHFYNFNGISHHKRSWRKLLYI